MFADQRQEGTETFGTRFGAGERLPRRRPRPHSAMAAVEPHTAGGAYVYLTARTHSNVVLASDGARAAIAEKTVDVPKNMYC